MKNFIYLTIIGLILLSTTTITKANEKYLDPEYIFRPDQRVNWPEDNGILSNSYEINSENIQKGYAHQWVTDTTRDGGYAIRLEIHNDDTGGKDKARKGLWGRTEFAWLEGYLGEIWYRYSMYIPKESIVLKDQFAMLMQIKTSSKVEKYQGNKACPIIPIFVRLQDGHFQISQDKGDTCESTELPNWGFVYTKNGIKDQWLDIVIHANLTSKDDGFVRFFVNGELLLAQDGKNMFKSDAQYPPILKHNLYEGKRIKGQDRFAPMVAYYDAFYGAKTCEDLKVDLLGYTCDQFARTVPQVQRTQYLNSYWNTEEWKIQEAVNYSDNKEEFNRLKEEFNKKEENLKNLLEELNLAIQ